MPIGRPQNAIRSSYRENAGNRGQDLIFKIKSCCRRRRECIGIRANCGKYLYSPHFLCCCFLSSGAGIQTEYTALPETSPDSPSASPYPQNNLYPAARHMNVTSSPIALGSASMTNIPIANQSNANPITFFIICPASGRWFGIILCPDFKFVHHFRWNLRNSEYP